MNKNMIKGIEVKLILISLFFTLFILIFSILHTMITIEKVITDFVQLDTLNLAENIKDVVSVDSFYTLNSREDENTQTYKDIQVELEKFNRSSELLYLYTAKKTEDNRYIYIIHGLDKNDKGFKHIGDPIEELALKDLEKCILSDKIVLADDIIINEDDVYSYATYFPMHNEKGEVIGVIGAEFDAFASYTVIEEIRNNNYKFVIISIIFAFFIIFFGIRKISSPYLIKLAYLDQLTGYGNRTLLEKDFQDKKFSHNVVIYIDANKFKRMNDTYGHSVGDKLIQCLAQNLKNKLEEYKFKDSSIYRLQGDEFVVTLRIENENKKERIEDLKLVMEEVSNKENNINDMPLKMSISAGVLIDFDKHEDIDTIYQKMDSAMYIAKRKNKHCVVIDNNDYSNIEFNIEMLLKEGISDDNVIPFIQPVFNVEKNVIENVEVLTRLKMDDKIIYPEHFIKAAVRTNTIAYIDLTVMEKALSILTGLMKQDTNLKDLKISFNISKQTIFKHNIINLMKNIISKFDVPYENIILEISESFADEISAIDNTLRELRTLGIKIVLDDFTAGNTSMSSAINENFDYIKVDKEVFWKSFKNEDLRHLYLFLSRFIKNKNKEIVVEGIEIIEHMKFSEENEINYLQGYLFSKPVELNYENLNKMMKIHWKEAENGSI